MQPGRAVVARPDAFHFGEIRGLDQAVHERVGDFDPRVPGRRFEVADVQAELESSCSVPNICLASFALSDQEASFAEQVL